MKKIILFFLAIVAAFSLSGCKVNWFGATYDAPWYVITAIIVAIFVIAHIRVMSGRYICPNCNTEIKLKWYQIYAYFHMGGKRYIICPNCKRKGFCKRKR